MGLISAHLGPRLLVLESRLGAKERRIEALRQRFGALGPKVGGLGSRFGALRQDLALLGKNQGHWSHDMGLSGQVESSGSRLGSLGPRFGALGQRLDPLGPSLRGSEAKIGGHIGFYLPNKQSYRSGIGLNQKIFVRRSFFIFDFLKFITKNWVMLNQRR